MLRPRTVCAVLAVVPVLLLPAPSVAAVGEGVVEAPGSRLVTLFAGDDLASTFNFRDGAAGAYVEDGALILDDAHIAFGLFREDWITFGFIRDEPVNVIDLGHLVVPGQARALDRSPRLPLNVFHTLFLDGTRVAYREPHGKVVRLKDGQRILDVLPTKGLYHIEPIPGHTYLVRYHREGAGNPHEVVKFLVVDVTKGRSLTLRWEHLGSL